MLADLWRSLNKPPVREGLAWLVFAIVLTMVTAFLFAPGCAPSSVGWSSGKGQVKYPPMVFEVKNSDVASAVTVTASWWLESTVVGSVTKTIPPAGSATFTFAALPDGIEVTSDYWPPNTGRVWSGPDLRGAARVEVDHPQSTWRRVP